MVLELVDGMDLSDYVKDYGALKEADALSVVLDAARGLQYGYEQVQRFIHRDVKPQNILLETGGGTGTPRAKLVDLGLARCLDDSFELTRAGQVMGTPISMAPEQFNCPTTSITAPTSTASGAFSTCADRRQGLPGAHADGAPAEQGRGHGEALRADPGERRDEDTLPARMLEPKQEDRHGTYGELIDAIKAARSSMGKEPEPGEPGRGACWPASPRPSWRWVEARRCSWNR